MRSTRKEAKGTTRRGFVKELSAGAAGVAVASVLNAAFLPAKDKMEAVLNAAANPLAQGAGLKYRKCFLNELTPEEREIGYGASNMFVVFADNDIIEGCHYFSAMFMGESSTKTLGHGPHKHQYAEVLVALGTDPANPRELGAEWELSMGEELEKHVINQPTLIYIPPNTVHCPFTIKKVTRPFIFIQANYGPKLIETPRRDLVPEELRNKYIFIEADGSSEKGKTPVRRSKPQ